MNVIVDTSAVLAILLNESSKNQIIEATKGFQLLAPHSIDAELGNALSAMFKRKRISLDNALLAFEQYEQIPIRKVDLDMELSLGFAHDLAIYAYDAYMLSSAIRFQSPLLSLDQTLNQHAHSLGVDILIQQFL